MGNGILVGERRGRRRISIALSSAVLEWVLMLLLFIDALYSYLVTKFARLCNLQVPCPLCSRLDHILGDEQPGFYRDLICKSHQSEISSLAFCHNHQKLADVCHMCEGCFFSYATEKPRNLPSESFVGELSMVMGDSEDDHYGVLDTENGESGYDIFQGKDAAEEPLLKTSRNCSCCSKPLKAKSHGVNLLQHKIDEVETDGISTNLHSRADTLLEPKDAHPSRNQGYNPLDHIGYSELNIESGSESEHPLSCDGDKNAMVDEVNDLEGVFVSHCQQDEDANITPDTLSLVHSNGVILENVVAHHALEPSESVVEEQLHERESFDNSSMPSAVATDHALDEVNWSKNDIAADHPSSKAISAETQQTILEYSSNENNLECVQSSRHGAASSGELCRALSLKDAESMMSQTSDPSLSANTQMSLSDAYKLAISNSGSLTSPKVAEVIIGKDSSSIHEDLKLLISQLSAARGLETPWNDVTPSPRIHGQDEYLVVQNITKRLSIERNESGLESLDLSIVSEIEGESVADRLRRQVELDRKSISLLYKELEEERNASAISANQAMAMITRLQEEKAVMQMEALQYQRMMEEQSEYDHEALQKCNELLAQKEKEVKDLEAELENYRRQLTSETFESKEEQGGDFKGKGSYSETMSHDKNSDITNDTTTIGMLPQNSSTSQSGLFMDSLLGFEDEKTYITTILKKLEQKLHLFSNTGGLIDVAKFNSKEDVFSEKASNPEGDVGRNDQHFPTVSSSENDSLSSMDGFSSRMNSLSVAQEACSENERQYSAMSNQNNLAAIEDEICTVKERIKALEADCGFLEHSINSLRNNDEGVQFIREIACNLRQLRAVGIRLK